jgi:hypothetical protein
VSRSEGRFFGVFALWCLCVFAGVQQLVAPSGRSGRLIGVFFSLCAVMGIGVVLADRAKRKAASRGPRLDHVEHGGTQVPAVVVDVPGTARQLGAVISGLVAAACAIMVVAAGSFAHNALDVDRVRVVGFVCGVFFGTLSIIGLVRLRRPFRPVLLPTGLRWERGASRYVSWDAVADVSLTYTTHDNPVIRVDVTRPDAIETVGARRRVTPLRRAVVPDGISIAAGALPIDARELVRAMADYVENPMFRPEIGTVRSRARLTGEADG